MVQGGEDFNELYALELRIMARKLIGAGFNFVQGYARLQPRCRYQESSRSLPLDGASVLGEEHLVRRLTARLSIKNSTLSRTRKHGYEMEQ